ncbi:MAG: AAA family ATPase [Clostridia bacterium]|nr:AAA family ATPase [Clostridia bacterium]
MFLGRERELALIRKEMEKPSAFVVVYGTRRVGKTALLLEAAKESPDKTVYFECSTGTLRYNSDRFVKTLRMSGFDVDPGDITSFEDAFWYLNGLGEKVNVIIDEYPYLKKTTKPHFVDSVFQNIVDTELKNIRLFLSGSDIGMMKELNRADNALFGRATLIMELKQWDYKETSACYPDLTPYEKVAYYSVFGGTPFVNTAIDPEKSLRVNITEQYLSETGTARVYVGLLLMTGDADAKGSFGPILATLGNGRKRYGELMESTRVDYDCVLTKNLDAAIGLGLVDKVFPVNKPGDVKKASYEICDNVLRFYYTYIYANIDKLYEMNADEFYAKIIEPSLTEFVSQRFEEVCREYFRRKVKDGEYRDACRVGTFYFDDPVTKENGEYDVAVKKEPYKDMYCYDIYEVKYLSGAMSEKKVRKETEDVRKIKGLTIQNVGFVSINGFEEDCEGILITGEDLYR